MADADFVLLGSRYLKRPPIQRADNSGLVVEQYALQRVKVLIDVSGDPQCGFAWKCK
jgi:hypothetical protein